MMNGVQTLAGRDYILILEKTDKFYGCHQLYGPNNYGLICILNLPVFSKPEHSLVFFQKQSSQGSYLYETEVWRVKYYSHAFL